MATRVHKATIDSTFQPFDDTVTDPDAYLNARDMQVFRKNHNIALARRCKRMVFTYAYVGQDLDASTIYEAQPVSRGNSTFLDVPLLLSALTKELVVLASAKGTNTTVPAKVYGVVDVGRATSELSSNFSLQVTTLTDLSMTIPVPANYRAGGIIPCTLRLFLDGRTYGADLHTSGTVNITGAGRDYVDLDIDPGSVSKGIYIETDAGVDWRRITSTTQISASDFRCYVDRPWNKEIVVQGGTANTRNIAGIVFQSLGVYEAHLTNLHDYVEVP